MSVCQLFNIIESRRLIDCFFLNIFQPDDQFIIVGTTRGEVRLFSKSGNVSCVSLIFVNRQMWSYIFYSKLMLKQNFVFVGGRSVHSSSGCSVKSSSAWHRVNALNFMYSSPRDIPLEHQWPLRPEVGATYRSLVFNGIPVVHTLKCKW